MENLKLAYLVSCYPAISHTFILREVLELRRLGIEIAVASVNHADRNLAQQTAEEQSETQRTFYVKKAGWQGNAKSLSTFLVRHPYSFFIGVRSVFKLGRLDLFKLCMAGFYLVEAILIADWMKKNSLKHLHVHFATPAATVALLLSRIRPITISLTVHGPDEFYNTSQYFLREKIAAARFICAIGLFARSQLMLLSPVAHWNKFEVVPLGVNSAHFAPSKNLAELKPFEILCVGRLVPAKGQSILLQAVAKLRVQGRTIQLRLVGDGPERSTLVNETKRLNLDGFVCFEGNVNGDRIRRMYESADLFVLASFAEGIPVVLMEAMAMEVPCIATNVNGIPELIRNEIDGLLVSPSDVDGLANAILRLMDNSELRQCFAQSARRRVLEAYNLETNVSKLAGVFHRRLSPPAA